MKPRSSTTHLATKIFYFPKSVISRFVLRRNIKSAIAWALVFGVYVASKAIGFVDSYPTLAARQRIAESFSNNIGIELLLGRAPLNASTGAYVAWNTLGITVVIGSIWAILQATKYFRGEEESGRTEILLAGQSTSRGVAINTLFGLFTSLGVFFLVLTGLFILIGRTKGLDFTTSSATFFALSVTLGISMFLLLGALTSQLMPTRTRAASVASIVLGLSFLLRAVGDITSFHFVVNFSPLGWVENLKPLSTSDPMWLVPIIVTCLLLIYLTLWFAGRRDLGESLIADKASSRPKLRLLGSPLKSTFRLTRANTVGWLLSIFLFAFLFGLLTKSAAQAFGQSASAEKVLTRLIREHQQSLILVFVSTVILILMTIIMVYVASSLGAIRREEASGLLDNFLVRPYSRVRWLSGRIFLIIIGILLVGGLILGSLWSGMALSHNVISLHLLFNATVNALVPAILTLGFGIFGFGLWPRLTTFFAYGIIGWSFLLLMISSGVHISHWLLDTSVLSQVSLAPAVSPVRKTDLIILLISLLLVIVGLFSFNRRDLESE